MITLAKIAGFFFDNPLGRLSAFVALAGFLITGFAYDQRKIGVRNDRAQLNESARTLAGQMEDARRAAERPGAAERLLKHSCSDC